MFEYEIQQMVAAERIREADHHRLVRAVREARKARRAARRSPGHDAEGPVNTPPLDRSRVTPAA